MIARAKKKAAKASLDIVFTAAAAQALPFPDARFDVVLTTIMLHHLPRTGRQQCASEISRVLKPGGRALAVDFASSTRKKRGFLSHLRLHSHGRVTLEEIIDLLSASGLTVIETGTVGFRDTQFALAIAGRGQQP
jgi:ubiquinone/menaquinone biosynthesis C-methylase UbiE